MKRLFPILLIVCTLAGLLRPFSVSAQGDPAVLLFEFEGRGDGSAQGWFYDDEFQQEPGYEEGFWIDDGVSDGYLDDYCNEYCMIHGGSQSGRYFTAVYSLGDDIEIQEISFLWTNKAEGVGSYVRVLVYDSAMEVVYSDQDSILAAWSGEKTFDLTDEEEPVVGQYIVIHAHHSWAVAIDWVELTLDEAPQKEGNYTLPLRSDDEAAPIQYSFAGLAQVNPTFESDTTTIAYASHAPGALVHSPTAALVSSIADFTTADCTGYGQIYDAPGLADLLTLGLNLATGNFGDLMGWAEGGQYICTPGALTSFDSGFATPFVLFSPAFAFPVMGQIIELTDLNSGRLIYYIVSDSDLFIEVGQVISAGCVLGYTLPLYYSESSLPSIPGNSWEYSGGGVGIIWAKTPYDAFEPILSEYKTYPNSDIPCNASTFVECLNENPRFTNAGAAYWAWVFDGSADRNPPGELEGLLLDDTGANSASQALMLNTENQYSIKVVAHVEHPNDGFTDTDLIVSLGTDSHTISLPYGGDEVEEVIALQTYEPDLAGGIYTLRVELGPDEDGAEVVASFICVDEDADPISALPSCLFSNAGFDSDSDWTLDDATITDGALRLPASAIQAIDLAVDSYVLEVRARGSSSSATETLTISASGTVLGVGGVSGAGGPVWRAQEIAAIADGTLTEINITHDSAVGSPSGTMTVEFRSNNSGNPGSVLWSGTYTVVNSSTNTIAVTSGPDVSDGTTYWLVVRPTSVQTEGNYWRLTASSSSVYSSGVTAYTLNGSSWTQTSSNDLALSLDFATGLVAALDWAFTPDGGGAALADGELTPGSNWEIIQSSPFNISSPASAADFEISSAADVEVDYVCLIPDSQPTAPPVVDYPDVRDCNSCPIRLTGESPHDIVETLQWHDCRARQLYYCDFRKLMVDTKNGVLKTVEGIGMLGRWLAASGTKQLTWFRSAFWYLGGLLNNVALGIQDSIAWSGGANTVIVSDTPLGLLDVLGMLITGLRDVLVTTMESLVELTAMILGFLAPIVTTMLEIITSAVSVLVQFIQSILDQVGIVHYMIASIIDGANNATPATIEGAPDCAASPEGLCWGFYILDNTIFSGPVADLLPILAGAATLNLLVWVLGKFKDAFASL